MSAVSAQAASRPIRPSARPERRTVLKRGVVWGGTAELGIGAGYLTREELSQPAKHTQGLRQN
ncbi:hypothetical protein GFGA_1d0736 [Gluconobacter frateurii NBRC 103465]|nr:hypothetical protein GFGA_1d0736 [Gluconobacter frateurii NBRC 103465]